MGKLLRGSQGKKENGAQTLTNRNLDQLVKMKDNQKQLYSLMKGTI